MTLDGGGSGGVGTPWAGISLDDMWVWVSRDLTPHYDQATSWKKTSELTGLYQSRLQAFRDKLAVAWNPKNSPAAEAYLTRLDELIKAVKDVNGVAGRNYQSSVDIPNAISEAKYKLKPIYDSYKAARANQMVQTPTPSTTPTATTTPTPTPRPAPSPSGSKPPATVMYEQHLAAQTVMGRLSGDLSRAQSGLGRPAPYTAPSVDKSWDDGSDYGGGVAPPFIPPVVPSPPPMPNIPNGPTVPMPTPKGPDLSGLTPVPPGPTPMPGGPSLPTPLPVGNGPVSPFPPGGVITPPGGPAGLPGGVRPPTPGIPGGGLGTAPVRGAMPAGGVIGGAPAGGARGAGGARPNPVGGMIGGSAAAGGRPGASGRGQMGGMGAAGVGGRGVAGGARGAMGAMGVGGRGGQQHDEDGEHFDPDTAWDVAHGVTPVLDAPAAQGPIDPGPAIGLSR